MNCTFFGCSDAPERIMETLYTTVKTMIEHHNVTKFYIGNHGNFDRMAIRALRELSLRYPHIQYMVVSAYYPPQSDAFDEKTTFPEEVACVPRRYAIVRRNQWMIDHADYVITYVQNSSTNALKYKEEAKRKGKHIIELAEI